MSLNRKRLGLKVLAIGRLGPKYIIFRYMDP